MGCECVGANKDGAELKFNEDMMAADHRIITSCYAHSVHNNGKEFNHQEIQGMIDEHEKWEEAYIKWVNYGK